MNAIPPSTSAVRRGRTGRILSLLMPGRCLPAIGLGILLLAAGGVAGATSLYNAALGRYRQGDYTGARKILAAKSKKDAGDYNLLGWAALKSERPADAAHFFALSIGKAPRMADSFCGLGFSRLRMGDGKGAGEAFARGLSLAPRNGDCLAGARLAQRETPPPPATASEPATSYYALGGYFWVREGNARSEPLFIKGVNLGFGLPGKFPTEFPEDEAFYLDWFRRIREMNANLIRVYTILPPAFYRAVQRFNSGKPAKERLLVMQGIWAELPPAGNFADPAYLKEVRTEVRNAVDVIHGHADLPHRYGHASGTYRADISDSVIGFIFGREWEPPAVAAYNRLSSVTGFTGHYLRIAGATPMEAWLTAMLDYLIGHETDTYRCQRPVAFTNWPPLDPLRHPTEATFQESVALRIKSGEPLSAPTEKELADAFDDDAVSLDEAKIVAEPAYRSGIFASYHVYPYYPDFLRYDPGYGEHPAPAGTSRRYFNYLFDLKHHYRSIPLLIAEFGLPTSRGIARYHPEGLNHGGLSEAAQASFLKEMMESIRESGCAGGMVFSWIDEWFKSSWMVKGTEERDQLWYDAQDPEESYGVIAMLPTGTAKMTPARHAWDDATILYENEDGAPLRSARDGHDGARHIRRILAAADAGYLYLRLDLAGPVDWKEGAYLLALNTTGNTDGDRRLPFHTGFESPLGFQYVILLNGSDSRLLIEKGYNRVSFDPALREEPGMSGYREQDDFRPLRTSRGEFTDIVTIHPRRFSRDGTVFPEQIYDASILRQGSGTEDDPGDIFCDKEQHSVAVRIPWHLLNFADPSRHRVIVSARGRRTSPGITIAAVAYRPAGENDPEAVPIGGTGKIADLVPRDLKKLRTYTWPGWETPRFVSRPKKAYETLRELYGTIVAPHPEVHIPPGFNFTTVIENEEGPIDPFRKTYEDALADPSEKDPYGLALAALSLGVVDKDPFLVLEAGKDFAAAEDAADPRVRKAAGLGLLYAEDLLSGKFPHAPGAPVAISRVTIEKPPFAGRQWRKIVIGTSAIHVHTGSTVATQVDRVTRDWLMGKNVAAPPWAVNRDTMVPWHEGEKNRDLMKFAGTRVKPIWGTIARKSGTAWYAPDAYGTYRFEISEDKVLNYPANIIIDDRTVLLNDTHGVSALAWDAAGADLVIGCGDYPGKIEAAYYLARRGINVYMPTDRFLPLLIGARTEGTIIGSAPVRKSADGAIIGNQPITIDTGETIVVANSTGHYPLQYYDTPYRYFTSLAAYLGKPLKIVPVDIEKYGTAYRVVEEARRIGAKLIGIRVWGKEEHDAVAAWLAEEKSHRAVLFHSAVYPEGYRLFFEFPHQTSFGDIAIREAD